MFQPKWETDIRLECSVGVLTPACYLSVQTMAAMWEKKKILTRNLEVEDFTFHASEWVLASAFVLFL